jgi:hypothetical protein
MSSSSTSDSEDDNLLCHHDSLKYLPPSSSSKLDLRCTNNDIMGNFACCDNPVIVGHMSDEDMRLKFKHLPYINELPCPFGCLNRIDLETCVIASFWIFREDGRHIDCRISKRGEVLTLFNYYFDFRLLKRCDGMYHVTELDRHFLSVREVMQGWRICKNQTGDEPKYIMIKIVKLIKIEEIRDAVQQQFLSIGALESGWRVIESKYLNDAIFKYYRDDYLTEISNKKIC